LPLSVVSRFVRGIEENDVKPMGRCKLTLTSPTGGGRSVGIVRSRTKATELVFSFRWRANRTEIQYYRYT